MAKAQKDQRQLGSLRATLADLGTKIESAKKRLEQYQFDQAEHTRLVKLLEDLTAAKNRLAPEVASLEARHAAHTRKLSDIDRAIEAKQKKYEEVSALHSTKQQELTMLRSQIDELRRDKSDLVANRNERLRLSLQAIQTDMADARAILKALHTTIGKHQKKADGLTAKAKEHDDLVDAIELAQEKLDGIEERIKERDAACIKKQKAVDDLDAELLQKRADFDAACKKKTIELNLHEKDLEEREGDLSRREQWHNKRSSLLRQAKAELEEIHGRPLRHIIIPPDLDPDHTPNQ